MLSKKISQKPLVLVVLDGWGCHKAGPYNAIATAHKPHWDAWLRDYPHAVLEASGNAVGLPTGQMGNSEVGHTHMGAGRVVYQELTRINEAIACGDFAQNAVLTTLIQQLKQSGKALHLMGLLSDGGVHSHQDHLFAVLKRCAELQFTAVYLHLFLDGRDTPPQSALTSLNALNEALQRYPVARIASISGRYYAMDRDKRWERVEPVYRLLTEAVSAYQFPTAEAAVQYFYSQGINDEFIPPTVICNAITNPPVHVQSQDAVFFFNFRADRARQLTEVFLAESFTSFVRNVKPSLCQFLSMTHYADYLPTTAVFAPVSLKEMLGEVIAAHDLKQLRIAETEKYAHVTFFFNGGREQPFAHEDRILIPSPKVATYDEAPKMSAEAITHRLVEVIQADSYDVIICNYANADMVGHTGNFAATVAAIECLDNCLGVLWKAIAAVGGALMITADHGNAEVMFDPNTNQPHTAHTSEYVPFLFIGEGWQCAREKGSLVDIAPTMLALLGIAKPHDMTGQSLLVERHAAAL